MQYHDLEKMKVSQLREMALREDPELEGVSGLSKERLVELVAAHHGLSRPHKVAEGIDKGSIKSRIRSLKQERAEAIAHHDEPEKRRTREELHRLRHELHKAARLHA